MRHWQNALKPWGSIDSSWDSRKNFLRDITSEIGLKDDWKRVSETMNPTKLWERGNLRTKKQNCNITVCEENSTAFPGYTEWIGKVFRNKLKTFGNEFLELLLWKLRSHTFILKISDMHVCFVLFHGASHSSFGFPF